MEYEGGANSSIPEEEVIVDPSNVIYLIEDVKPDISKIDIHFDVSNTKNIPMKKENVVFTDTLDFTIGKIESSNSSNDTENGDKYFQESPEQSTSSKLNESNFKSEEFSNKHNNAEKSIVVSSWNDIKTIDDSNRESAISPLVDSAEKSYTCEVCGRTFSRKYTLTNHQIVHTRRKPFTCDVCGRSFSLKFTLSNHQRVHTGEKPYTCDICGRAFSQKGTLTEHQIVHTGEKPYACDICGKAFSHNSTLLKHKKGHNGEKPFSCDVCGKSFSRKYTLSNHLITHRDEKPFSCTICDKKFTRKSILSKHHRMHACERKIVDEDLKIKNETTDDEKDSGDITKLCEKSTHNYLREYSCSVCFKSLSQKSCLTMHKRVHANHQRWAVRTNANLLFTYVFISSYIFNIFT